MNELLDYQNNENEENCDKKNDDIFDKDVKEYENEDFPEEVPAEVRKIRTQPYDYSVDFIVNKINTGKIYLEPEFQRNARVWDDKTASLLIESVLLNVPIPPIKRMELGT